ncbi:MULTISPECIES: PBP1A family penicillin-binding protein [Bacillus]|uniref:PBP1A family penicillin-binding protein n=1 Tax=Bacillus glycinifermentans TaxID=1664069 RepID=A0AAJ3Z048_9BACI|nr:MULTISPECIES: PBP1A family penicillin-binding protein [Bacillus]KKB73799.1 peptidase [Bacillus sp. TH008]MBU8784870.1 PBP1A family penicillin-binding protein [Bacillus glycinifermentans]MDU0073086.1 PBP1A family penicillin-binding protein [Bacillus sp. IG6]MED8020876.1 PBP1A family penicillin-binding protein [Bacillus glycinifermentans]NUJ18993.1 PBP1A family penicillin-binding protein [Bacillus glycinifermentans]
MSDQFKSRQERRRAQQGNSRSNTHSKPRKKKKPGLFKKILLSILIIGVIGLIAGGVTFAVMVSDAPSLDEAKLKTPYSSTIYDKNGKKIAELGSEKRKYVSIKDIPDKVKNAFLATEDARFYDHHGVDPIRIGGALLANFEGGFGSEGGSTITQQVVKNSLLSHEKTLKRKVQEVWLSLQLERKYSKDEILEMYLNRIYFSPQAYGIGKAAEQFYGVTNLNDLTVEQAATLAGMPQSPNNYNPIKHPEQAEKRRNIVLSLMNKHGFLSDADYSKAKKVSVKKGLVSAKQYAKSNSNKYTAFIEDAVEEVESKANVNPNTDGLKIYTTLDTDAQDYLNELMDKNSGLLTDKMKAGLTLLDTKTGEVRAVGGNMSPGGWNYATATKRQPGSTIKPILDYGPVIENKKWSTYEQIKDEPYTYSTGQEIHNYDLRYKSWISMREALADSRNIPAVKAFQAAGKENVANFANGLGLSIDKDDLLESYAIGGFGKGVSTLQMAGAYSAFGNNGYYNEPHFVSSVEFNDGTKLDLTPESKAAMSDYTAFMITDMLKTAVQTGTGTAAQVPGVTVAGKTGTTNFEESDVKKYGLNPKGARDSWFVGYTPQYTAAVWTGKDGMNSLNVSEQQIAKLLFKKVIAKVDDGSGSFKKPDSVVEATVVKGSNPAALASSSTPSDKKTTEYFVKGTQPTTVSTQYEEKEDAAKPSGLSAEYDEASKSIKLSWSYSGDDDASFKVKQSVDGGGYTEIQNSSAKEAVIPNAKEGSVYRFQVTAVTDDDESDPASVTLKVNAASDDETKADDDQQNQDDQQNKDDDQTTDEDKNKDQQDTGDNDQSDDQKQTPGDTNKDNQNSGDTDKDNGNKDKNTDDSSKNKNNDKNQSNSGNETNNDGT